MNVFHENTPLKDNDVCLSERCTCLSDAVEGLDRAVEMCRSILKILGSVANKTRQAKKAKIREF